MDEEAIMAKRRMPTGVKVISIFCYIGAFFGLIIGFFLVIKAGYIKEKLVSLNAAYKTLNPKFFVVIGIILLLVALINFVIGIGLWKGKNLARIVVIVFSCIGILGAIISILISFLPSAKALNNKQVYVFRNLVSLSIYSLIFYYLLFNAKVKAAFSKNQ